MSIVSSSCFVAVEAAFGLPATFCACAEAPRWLFKTATAPPELQITPYFLNKSKIHESKIITTLFLCVNFSILTNQVTHTQTDYRNPCTCAED